MEILGIFIPGAVIGYLLFIKLPEWLGKSRDAIEAQNEKAGIEKERINVEYKQKYNEQWRLVDELIRKHSQTLAEKRSNMTSVDDYGVCDTGNWEQEKSYFIERVIQPELGSGALPLNSNQLAERVDTILDHHGF